MARTNGVKYNFSGRWEEVLELLRSYSTADVLKRINKESVDLFYNNSNSDIKAVKRVVLPLYKKGSVVPEKQDVFIMAWSLIDLAYYMIKTSNDYRGKIIEFDEELYVLHVAVDNYKEREEKHYFDHNDRNDFFMYLWGFAGEQFKSEVPALVFDNLSRELYMLFDLNDKQEFDMEKAVIEEIGLPWDQVAAFLMLAWFGFTQVGTLSEISNVFGWSNEEKKEQFINVIRRYSADYDEIRKSPLGRQILYAKPYVRTQRGEIVSVSAYLNFFLCEHSILWLIRDHFKKQGRQDFTNYFGGLFEKYFLKLVQNCLDESEYERIPESKEKRADWKLTIGTYKFLVEQKSTIMRLSVKQQQTDINAIKDFATGTILKAVRQLNKTEKDFADGKYIKIILLYEDYLKPELLEQFFNMPECNIENDSFYWLATIEEMEMLFNTAKKDRDLFEKIVAEKIAREINHSKEGKSLIQLLNENGIKKNEYVRQEKFQKYRNIVQDKTKDYF